MQKHTQGKAWALTAEVPLQKESFSKDFLKEEKLCSFTTVSTSNSEGGTG